MLRILQRCKDGLRLKVALKPHACAITALAYSPDGQTLATGASDGAVFFVASGSASNYAPIGFMRRAEGEAKAAAAVTAVGWSADSRALMVGYSDGALLELKAPLPGVADTSETFELPLDARDYDLEPLREQLRADPVAFEAESL